MILLVVLFIANLANGQIYQLGDLSTTQLDDLDRETTVVIIPTGVLEQHGPHLPLYTDGYHSKWLTQQLAETLVSRRGVQVVILPMFPIGVGEPEEFAPRKRYPGSYAVRASTQRAVLMDIATGLGEDGFKWIFVMAFHGPIIQSRSIEQACEYFGEVYGGTMVNLWSATHPNPPATSNPLNQEEKQAAGYEVHAGLVETSNMLFIRADLVDGSYSNLETLTPKSWEELHTISRVDNWPGYFGAPGLAQTHIGANWMRNWADNVNDLALKILDGLDPKTLGSYTDSQNPAFLKLDEEIMKLDQKFTDQQTNWLKSKGYE